MPDQETGTDVESGVGVDGTLSDDSLMTAAAAAASASTCDDDPMNTHPCPAEEFATPPPTPPAAVSSGSLDESRMAEEEDEDDDDVITVVSTDSDSEQPTSAVGHSDQNGVMMDIDQQEVIQSEKEHGDSSQHQVQANPESTLMSVSAATEDLLLFPVQLPPESSTTTETTPFPIYINRNNFTPGEHLSVPSPFDNTLPLNFVCSINANGEPALTMLPSSSSPQPQLPPSPLPSIPTLPPLPTPTTTTNENETATGEKDNEEEANKLETPFPEFMRLLPSPPRPILSLVQHDGEEGKEKEMATPSGSGIGNTNVSIVMPTATDSDDDSIEIEILSIHSPRKRTLSAANHLTTSSTTVNKHPKKNAVGKVLGLASSSKEKKKTTTGARRKEKLPDSVMNEVIQEVSVFAQKSAVPVSTSEELPWRKCAVCLSKQQFTDNVFAVKMGKPQILKKIEPLLSHLALPDPKGTYKDTGLCFTCMDSLQRFHIFKSAVTERHQGQAMSVGVVVNNGASSNRDISSSTSSITQQVSQSPSSPLTSLKLERFELQMFHQNYFNMKKVKEVYNSSTHSHFVRRHLTDKDWEFFCQKLYPLLLDWHKKDGVVELKQQQELTKAKELLEKYFNSKEKLSQIFCGICSKLVEDGKKGFLQHLATLHHQLPDQLYLPCDICGILVPEHNNKQNGVSLSGCSEGETERERMKNTNRNSQQDYFSHWISHFYSNSSSTTAPSSSSQLNRNNLNVTPPEEVSQKKRKQSLQQRKFPVTETPLPKEYPGSSSNNKPKKSLSSGKARRISLQSNEQPLSCKMCDKQFKSNHTLKAHQVVHSGAYPFHCSACGKGIRQKGDIAKHLRTHKKDMPTATAIAASQLEAGASAVPPPSDNDVVVEEPVPVTPSNTMPISSSSTARPTIKVIPSPSQPNATELLRQKKLIPVYLPPVPAAKARRSISQTEAAYLSMPNLSGNEIGQHFQPHQSAGTAPPPGTVFQRETGAGRGPVSNIGGSSSPHQQASAENQQQLSSLAAAASLCILPTTTLPPSTTNPSSSHPPPPQQQNQRHQVTSFGGVGYSNYNSEAEGEQNQGQLQQHLPQQHFLPYGYQQHYYGMGNNGNANATVIQQSVPFSGDFNFPPSPSQDYAAVRGAGSGSGAIPNQNKIKILYYYPPHHHYQQ